MLKQMLINVKLFSHVAFWESLNEFKLSHRIGEIVTGAKFVRFFEDRYGIKVTTYPGEMLGSVWIEEEDWIWLSLKYL